MIRVPPSVPPIRVKASVPQNAEWVSGINAREKFREDQAEKAGCDDARLQQNHRTRFVICACGGSHSTLLLRALCHLTPAEFRGNILQDRLNHMGVVGDTKLVRHGEQESIGFGNRLILRKLLN